ncbi:MAG: TIGR00282 family metallophosphoesterase [Candidatus Hydrogenedentota bacterium]
MIIADAVRSSDALDTKPSRFVSIMFIGDIVGRPGRRAVAQKLDSWAAKYRPELIIANVENAAGGSGLTIDAYKELDDAGVDVFTSGNHIWAKKDVFKLFGSGKRLVRPANFPKRTPGSGCGVFRGRTGHEIGVINLMGRVFMDPHLLAGSPFDSVETALAEVGRRTHVSIVDFHAEATSEKQAMGWYLNGRVSAVIGTHTHVQTADEKVLPGGTAYISDAGMTGPTDSVIGMSKKIIIEKLLTGVSRRYEVARAGEVEMNGVLVKVRYSNGRALSIERLQEVWQL